MFGLTKKIPPNQTDDKNNNLNLSQQKDFDIADMPIHTMQEDLENPKNPNTQPDPVTIKNAAQKLNQNNLSQKQKSSPFLTEDVTAWNKRLLLTEKDAKKPELPKEIDLDKITQNEKKGSPFIQTEKAAPPSFSSDQKNTQLPTRNASIKKGASRLVLFYSAVFLFLTTLTWLGYSFLKNKSAQREEPVVTDLITKTPTPEIPKEIESTKPTFSYSKTNPNYFRLETSDSVTEKLNALLAQVSLEGYETPVEFIITDQQNKPTDFKSFASLFNLQPSGALIDMLGDNFSIFIHNTLAGARIGLAIEAKNNSGLEKVLTQEEKMLADELGPLFLGNTYDKTKPFEDTTYAGARIHYQNIISPDILSVDYAIYKNKLIFGTTRATMRAIIDKINNLAPLETDSEAMSIPVPKKSISAQGN